MGHLSGYRLKLHELVAALPHFSRIVLDGCEELNMAFIGKDLQVWRNEPSDFACDFYLIH